MIKNKSRTRKNNTRESKKYYSLKKKLKKQNSEKFEFEEAEIRALNKELGGE